MKIIINDNAILSAVDKYKEEFEKEICKLDPAFQKVVLKDNMFLMEKDRIKYENDLLVATGILIPFAFAYFSLTSLFGTFKPLADALILLFFVFYVLYCMNQIKKKGKVINQIYAIQKLLDEF